MAPENLIALNVPRAMKSARYFQTAHPLLCSHSFPLVLIFFAVLGSEISGEEDVTAVEGDDALLVCEAEGNPTPWVTWTAPNGTVLQSGTGPDTNLTLYNVTRSDSGTYVCNVTNTVGVIMVKRRLDVLCKCSLGSSFIVFICFPLMTRRGIQSFRHSCFVSCCRGLARFPPSSHGGHS